MKKIVKIVIICLLAVMAVNLCESYFTFNEPAYASMGSTGGLGGGGFGGGSTDSEDEDDGTSSDDDEDDGDIYTEHPIFAYSATALVILVMINMFVISPLKLVYFFVSGYFARKSLAFRLRREYGSNYLAAKWVLNSRYDLFTPNSTIEEFEEALEDLGLKLRKNRGEIDESFTETYGQAQFLYSQLLRQRYADHHADLSELKRYLDDRYYHAMVSEIKEKVKWGTVDDTVVYFSKIEKFAFLDEGLIAAKVDVRGHDSEVQFNVDFEKSFDREEWSDYVIFGKTKQGNYKILNLVYGEHFHLNGHNFSSQASLNGDKYTQRVVKTPEK